jgi:hypothetical protein
MVVESAKQSPAGRRMPNPSFALIAYPPDNSRVWLIHLGCFEFAHDLKANG